MLTYYYADHNERRTFVRDMESIKMIDTIEECIVYQWNLDESGAPDPCRDSGNWVEFFEQEDELNKNEYNYAYRISDSLYFLFDKKNGRLLNIYSTREEFERAMRLLGVSSKYQFVVSSSSPIRSLLQK